MAQLTLNGAQIEAEDGRAGDSGPELVVERSADEPSSESVKRSAPLTAETIRKKRYASSVRFITNDVVVFDKTTNLEWERKTKASASAR